MQISFPDINSTTVAVIGLGYVGMPLALEIASSKTNTASEVSTRSVIGFDIDIRRIKELQSGQDSTLEIQPVSLLNNKNILLTNDPLFLRKADVFIVTVPTPVDSSGIPDLRSLISATELIGDCLKFRANQDLTLPVIIYESTVYPGATEEVCVPIIEQRSGLSYNTPKVGKGFYCGYSPERINPGDKVRLLTNIVKITSGSSPDSSIWVDNFYKSFISAGTHLAPTIKVAEAAKVVENTQRDLNIALANELALIFEKLQIDTNDVIDAASTKWNFTPFRPGLVGGHCIGVDPLYLTYKAEQHGYYPQVVLSGRRVNDDMPYHVAIRILKALAKQAIPIHEAEILILGVTFKENCPDMRNTRVADLIQQLEDFGFRLTLVDPWVDPQLAKSVLNKNVIPEIPVGRLFTCIVASVAHQQFLDINSKQWMKSLVPNGIIMDIKGIMPRDLNPMRL